MDQGIVTAEELLSMTDCRDEADVILTGKVLPPEIQEAADKIEQAVVL